MPDGPQPLVQVRAQLADGVAVDEVHAAAVGRARVARVEPGAGHVHLPLGDRGDRAEAVAAVDRVLGGDQRRDGVAALLGGPQVAVHHAAEQPAAAVGGGDGDVGDGVGGERGAAGHAQALREAAEGGHAAPSVVGALRPVEVHGRTPEFDLLLRHGGRPEEAGAHGAHPVGEVGLRDRAHFEVHGASR
ncbi:hypothetical protein GCM10020000_35250 [Streptomyces olivoverticillatus]